MKKTLLFLLFFTTLLSASSSSQELKIRVLKSIVTGIENSEPMTIWSDDKKIMNAFTSQSKFSVADDCKDAKMIILSSKSNLPKNCKNKHIFVLDYELLYEIPDSFGAFFWKKGRPNIVFIKPRVDKQALKLTSSLEPYVEERLW